MGYLGNPAGFTGTQANKRISVSATADQTAFVISGGYQVNQIDVYRNGVKLVGGSDFTAIDGSTVTLLQGATNGDNVEFVIFENFDVAGALGTSGEQILNGNLTVSGGSITGNLVGIVTGDVTGNVSGTAGTFTGHVSATQGFSGNVSGTAATFTGDVTIGGVLTYEDVTNIDSVGLITARNGLQVLAGIVTVAGQTNLANVNVSAAATVAGSLKVGSNTLITPDSNADNFVIDTGDVDSGLSILSATTGRIYFGDAADDEAGSIRYVHTDNSMRFETNSTERLRITSGGLIDVSGGIQVSENVTPTSGAGLELFREGNGGGQIQAYDRDSSAALPLILKGSTQTFFTNGTERLRITSTGDFKFTNGGMIERVKITAGKLSDNTNIDLENGNVHHFTTQETTTSTPNIRVNSSTSLNSVMSIGDTIAVTLITTAAAAGYSAQLTIDGSAVTEKWNGGSAPSAGGSSGNDVITYQIIKTADATYTVLGNVTNFA